MAPVGLNKHQALCTLLGAGSFMSWLSKKTAYPNVEMGSLDREVAVCSPRRQDMPS